MEETVSVIIPVYNSQNYIERCIESILNQSYKNLRIILVDDFSNDKSSDICIKYSRLYKNIDYIKNERRFGPSVSRNIGLNLADSKYVLFIDSDDWLDLNCISKALDCFHSDEKIDIVLWEIQTAYSNKKICDRYKYNYNNVITSKMAISLLSHSFENEYFISPLLGCKLFKTSLLKDNKITFIDSFYEDDVFSFISFLSANKVGIITGSGLYYYQHSESITHIFSEKHVYDLFKSFKKIHELVKNFDNNSMELFYCYLQKCLYSLISRLNNCVSEETELNYYKTLILKQFNSDVNIEEYYKYCKSLTI